MSPEIKLAKISFKNMNEAELQSHELKNRLYVGSTKRKIKILAAFTVHKIEKFKTNILTKKRSKRQRSCVDIM